MSELETLRAENAQLKTELYQLMRAMRDESMLDTVAGTLRKMVKDRDLVLDQYGQALRVFAEVFTEDHLAAATTRIENL